MEEEKDKHLDISMSTGENFFQHVCHMGISRSHFWGKADNVFLAGRQDRDKAVPFCFEAKRAKLVIPALIHGGFCKFKRLFSFQVCMVLALN